MPGLYDSLTTEMLRAGPRRVTIERDSTYCIHATPPPHVPPLPTDESPPPEWSVDLAGLLPLAPWRPEPPAHKD